MNGYQIVCEAIKNQTFYHTSPTQNLKVLDPRDVTQRIGNLGKKVFVSDDKGFSSAFGFLWGDNEGFKFGKRNNEPWTLQIPKQFKSRVMKPCSIYTVENKDYIPIHDMASRRPIEFYSLESVKILKEEKYKTALEAMMKNGVKVVYT